MSVADAELFDQVYAVFAEYQAQYPQRPKGWVHSDLFRDNTLFKGDELQGILDFFELNFDELLFDVAITINDFCSQFPNVELDCILTMPHLTILILLSSVLKTTSFPL